MRILGLDLSLVGTGYVILDNGKISEQKLIKSKPCGKDPKSELERLMRIRDSIKVEGIDLAVIEGMAFMARNSVSLVQLSALNYMTRELLYKNNVKFIIVAPTTLKKFVTSKGNVKKDQMILETYKKFNESFEDDNICDAFGLAHCGYALLGNKDFVTTKQQEEVLGVLGKQLT